MLPTKQEVIEYLENRGYKRGTGRSFNDPRNRNDFRIVKMPVRQYGFNCRDEALEEVVQIVRRKWPKTEAKSHIVPPGSTKNSKPLPVVWFKARV
jgi:hypothetical protein